MPNMEIRHFASIQFILTLISICWATTHDRSNQNIVDLTTEIPLIPDLITVTELRYQHNLITNVPNDIFHGMPALNLLAIHRNQIGDISDNAFSNISSITVLYLGWNNLEVVKTRMFSGEMWHGFRFDLIVCLTVNHVLCYSSLIYGPSAFASPPVSNYSRGSLKSPTKRIHSKNCVYGFRWPHFEKVYVLSNSQTVCISANTWSLVRQPINTYAQE